MFGVKYNLHILLYILCYIAIKATGCCTYDHPKWWNNNKKQCFRALRSYLRNTGCCSVRVSNGIKLFYTVYTNIQQQNIAKNLNFCNRNEYIVCRCKPYLQCILMDAKCCQYWGKCPNFYTLYTLYSYSLYIIHLQFIHYTLTVYTLYSYSLYIILLQFILYTLTVYTL